MVEAHTEKVSNSREGNRRNVLNNETLLRSDRVTEVPANPIPTPNIQQPRRTPQSFQEPQMDDFMTAIQNLQSTMLDGVLQSKKLPTQVPSFRGNRGNYNEFEHLKNISDRTYTN